MNQRSTDSKRAYEPPTISDIGSLHDLTLVTPKDATGSDGFVFNNVPLGPVS